MFPESPSEAEAPPQQQIVIAKVHVIVLAMGQAMVIVMMIRHIIGKRFTAPTGLNGLDFL